MTRVLLAAIAATAALVSLVDAPSAPAATRTLWPGVTHDRTVEFTPNGPVVLSVLRGPRPGGATTLEPVLSNESVLGLETLSAMQRRLASTAVTAGVNGDFFTFATGRPSGVLMREGALVVPPRTQRASAGITSDGALDVRRVGFFGSWQAAGPRRPLSWLNEAPAADGAALFTSDFGPETPLVRGASVAVLFPFPAPVVGADLPALVGEIVPSGSPVEIPEGGAVVVARGRSAVALTAEAVVGEQLLVRLQLRPDWPGVVAAIGGGPQIVRDGVPVFRANEAFTTVQLSQRAPRSAVGQLRDGRIVLVAVDGRQPSLSVGLTNYELGRVLARLGAVTAMALDSGGSTTMAFDGTVLNSPSDGRERRIATALVLAYRGVFLPEPPARVSPNGDGVDDRPGTSVRVVRPSTVGVRVLDPTGRVTFEERAERLPGTYPVPFPPEQGVAPSALDTALLGTWTVEADATDDLGRATRMTRTFQVDDTLGFLQAPRRLVVPAAGASLPVRWKLARPATVTVSVLGPEGATLRTLLRARLQPGAHETRWDGLRSGGKPPPAGIHTVRVVAVGPAGRSELVTRVAVRPAK